MLARQLERAKRSQRMDALVVATSDRAEDDPIQTLCEKQGVACFRGNLNDVLDRFYLAAKPYASEHVVRLTGDCPLIDPEVVDATIEFYLQGAYDYASNAQAPYTFPDGLDVEVFRFQHLERAAREAELPSYREHVTPFMSKHPEQFTIGHYTREPSLGHLRWTVDEPEDFEMVRQIYEALYPINPSFTTRDILALLKESPNMMRLNSHIARNAGVRPSLAADAVYLQTRV